MKKTIIAVSVLMASCGYHWTPNKTENGIVIEKQWHQQALDADGISINSNGEVGYHTLTDKEKFIVVFKCDHGVVFSINRNNIYATVEKGDSVKIIYRELLNGNNEVRNIDFINAYKK
jgi:hypothetical protein